MFLLVCYMNTLPPIVFCQVLCTLNAQDSEQKPTTKNFAGFYNQFPGFDPPLGHRVVLLDKTPLSKCLSSPRRLNGYRQIYCWG